ncbi:hypothetical protein [Pseudomonas putida]|uniref:hypothetical protein n=1 Tax=Pseudomonas putida TaxID=303 RepID=UPI0011106188|nr:hypothetical protein [Pseudomonas putida]
MSTEALTIIASILLACMAISVCVIIYFACRSIEAIEKALANASIFRIIGKAFQWLALLEN